MLKSIFRDQWRTHHDHSTSTYLWQSIGDIVPCNPHHFLDGSQASDLVCGNLQALTLIDDVGKMSHDAQHMVFEK